MLGDGGQLIYQAACVGGGGGNMSTREEEGGDTHTQVVTGRTGNSQGQSQGQNGTRFALRTGLLRVHTHTHTARAHLQRWRSQTTQCDSALRIPMGHCMLKEVKLTTQEMRWDRQGVDR